MKSLNIIGCGRVGKTLARLWHDQGRYRIQDVLTRSESSALEAIAFIGSGRAVRQCSEMRSAEVWMLAVPDRQSAKAAADLALFQNAQSEPPGIAFHCSGALASTELLALQKSGWPVASAHCLLSFAKPDSALQQFAGTPCALEGDPAALSELEQSFTQIGARCFALAPENKLLYHAGAVFATNFLPVLQSVANQLWATSGVPADVARHLNASLLKNAVDNLLALGPAGALTGPAARGDVALVQRQGDAVAEWDATAGEAYRALSQLAAKLANPS